MTLRKWYKRRYIVFEVAERESEGAVIRKVVDLSRELTSPGPKLRLVYYNRTISRGLIRCGHKQTDEIRQKIGAEGKMKALGTSGTIKAAKRKFLATSPA